MSSPIDGVRKNARERLGLTGADARMLEQALTEAEQEIEDLRERVEDLRSELDESVPRDEVRSRAYQVQVAMVLASMMPEFATVDESVLVYRARRLLEDLIDFTQPKETT